MDHDEDQGSIMYGSIPDNYAFEPEYDYFFDEANCSLRIKIRTLEILIYNNK